VVESGIMGLAGYVAALGERRDVYRVLVGNTERKREPGTGSRRCGDNIKVYLQEVGWNMDWIDLVYDIETWQPCVNGVMNLCIT
jgi:hypothetical protein